MKSQAKHITEQVGRQVRKLRLEKGWTQLELGVEAGIDKSYVIDIEKGKANPTIKKLAKIADALDVDVLVLFSWTRRKKTEE